MEFQPDRFQCYTCLDRIPPIAPGNYMGFGWPPCLRCGHVLCQQCLEDACLDGNYEMCARCEGETGFAASREDTHRINPHAALPSKDRQGGQDCSPYCDTGNYGLENGTGSSRSDLALEMMEKYHMEALATVNNHFKETIKVLELSRAMATKDLWESFERYSKIVLEDRERTPTSDRVRGASCNDPCNVKQTPTNRSQIGPQFNYDPEEETEAMTDNCLSHVALNAELPESYSTRVEIRDSFTSKANNGPERSRPVPVNNVKSVGESFAVEGLEIDGQVMEVQTLSAFYVQPLTRQLEILKRILIDLNKDDDQGYLGLYFNPRKGDLCAAKWSEDQLWYRAIIEHVESPGHFRVFFVDFGRREVRDASSLRQLDPSMASLPAQAVLCSLAGIRPARPDKRWSQFAIGAFSERVLTKNCRLRVVQVQEGTVGRFGSGRKEYSLRVELSIDGDSVNEEFVHRLLADHIRKDPRDLVRERLNQESRPSVPKLVPGVPESPFLGPVSSFQQTPEVRASPAVVPESCPGIPGPVPVIPGNGRREVKLLSFDSPGDFTLYLADAGHDPLLFHGALLSAHSSASQVMVVRRGEVYSVWNEAEGKFFRGRAQSDVNTEETSVKLDLIDAGTFLTVDKQHVKELPGHLAQSGPQSIRCRLSGIQPAGGVSKWTQVSCERFAQLVTSAAGVFAEFHNAEEDTFHQKVNLYAQFSSSAEEELVCINDLLVSDGLALRKGARALDVAAKTVDSRPTKKEKKPVPPWSTHFRVNEWTSPEPLTEKQFSGYVTWINEHGHAYVQHIRHVNTSLETISTALETMYSKTRPEENVVLKPGEACIARYSEDQVWYRASVVGVDEARQRALVMFCDYGNKEELPFSELRHQLTCTNFPIQANKCLLSKIQPPGGTWTEESAEAVLTLISGRCCQIEVEEFGTIPKISVYLEDGTPLRDLLDSSAPGAVDPVGGIRTSAASSDNGSDTVVALVGNSSTDSAVQFKEFVVPEVVNRLLPVTVLQLLAIGDVILKPDKFPKGSSDQIEAQWDQQILDFETADSFIQSAVLSSMSGDEVKPGTLCIAWDQARRKWSRALVKATHQAGFVLVEMIDTMQLVSLPVGQLKTAPWSLCDAPRNAIRAKLTGFASGPAAVTSMEKQLKGRLLWAQFNGGKFSWSVEMFVDRNHPRVSLFSGLCNSGASGTAIPRARRL